MKPTRFSPLPPAPHPHPKGLKLKMQEAGKELCLSSGPNLTKGMLHTKWCASARTAPGKKEKGGMFVVIVFVCASKHYSCWGSAGQQVANISLPRGHNELIPYFAWLLCAAFAFPIKMSQQWSTSLFSFLVSSPHLQKRKKMQGWVVVSQGEPTTDIDDNSSLVNNIMWFILLIFTYYYMVYITLKTHKTMLKTILAFI